MRVSVEGKWWFFIMTCALPWNRHACAFHLLLIWRTVSLSFLKDRVRRQMCASEPWLLVFLLHCTIGIKEASPDLWDHEGAKPRLVWHANTCDSHTLPQPRVKYRNVFHSLNALSSPSSWTAGVIYSFVCIFFTVCSAAFIKRVA